MDRHILIKCPRTGMHVQHWLEDEPNELEGVINPKTGKLWSEKK